MSALLADYNEGLSEFSFAGFFMFRESHHYAISRLSDQVLVLSGNDEGNPFCIFPAGIPEKDMIDMLLEQYGNIKCVSETRRAAFLAMGYNVEEDRDNFDYLYFRNELAELPGKKFRKKRNFVTGFMKDYQVTNKPISSATIADAQEILQNWHATQEDPADYAATSEALAWFGQLDIEGRVFYIDTKPAAFVIGEPLPQKISYVIHFEKADTTYRGIYQYINKAYAEMIPEEYIYLNREQDLGNEGLRQAKLTYRPCAFLKKYRVFPAGGQAPGLRRFKRLTLT